MRQIVADLHNHSTFSDGEYSPADIVRLASEHDLSAVSLTDHDTVAGVEEALEACTVYGVQVIPGTEVTLRFRRPEFTGSLHVLLYFTVELFRDTGFRADLDSVVSQGRGIALVEERVRCINSIFGPRGKDPVLSCPLEVLEITSLSSNATRRHFALALSENHGLVRGQVSRLIGNDSPAYVPSGVDMYLLKPLVRAYPVLPVLAHPAAGSFPAESHYREVLPPLPVVEALLPQFLDLGIRGLEVWYPGHTSEHCHELLSWASGYSLVVTGGSDCHDSVARPFGAAGITNSELSTFLAALRDLPELRSNR